MGRGLRAKQGDGRKTLPHILTGIAAVALSLGLTVVTQPGKAGPAGPAGKSASVSTSGVCWYFGPDGRGTDRFQVSTPYSNGTCPPGHHFVSVLPGR